MAKATTVGTFAVLALAGGIAYRSGQAPPSGPASGGGSGVVANTVIPAATSPKSNRIEGPCQVIRDYLDHADLSPKDNSVSGHIAVNGGKGDSVDFRFSGSQPEKGEENTGCGEQGRLVYMIALVADPVNTHLAITFDRTVESVVRGATAAGYSYVNYYFPWEMNLSRDQPEFEKRRAQREEKRRLEKWPGLLLFRGDAAKACDHGGKLYGGCPLAVFLVSETPTAGINRIEFQRAVSYISNAEAPRFQISIVGPTFSGSAESLIDAIDKSQPNIFKVFNGSATSGETRGRIEEQLQLRGSSFLSFIHADQLSFRKMAARWTGAERIGILSEDATSFGGQQLTYETQGAGHRIVQSVTFPREISQLRNAVQPGAEAGPAAGVTPQLRQLLPLDLRDVVSGHDSIPVYSSQTPSSQEAALTNIGRELREGRYRFVGVMASDPLDVIFLSRAVRDLWSDSRLFLLDNDLLLVRATADSPLDGTLSATTYPLLLAPERGGRGSIVAFPNQISEALYNATVAILASYGTPAAQHVTGELLGYSTPSAACPDPKTKNCDQAPIWITMLTRSGYWPVSIFAVDRGEATGMASWSERKITDYKFDRPDRLWMALFVILSILVFLYGWFVIQAHVSGSEGIHRWRESFWSIPGECDFAGRAAYLLAKSLTILGTYCIVTAPFWRLYWSRSSKTQIIVILSGFLIGWLLAAALVPFFPWRRANLEAPTPWNQLRKDTHFGLAVVVVALTAGSLVAWYLTVFQTGANMEPAFLAWRSVNPLSGVSPMLPVLFLAAGVLWWAWMHFRRLILLSERTPVLPKIDQAGMQFEFSGLGDSVKEAVGQAFFHWRWRVVIAMLILFVILIDQRGLLQTIEGRTYEYMYRAVLGLLVSLIFLTFSRMLVVWERLKEFLEQLERHPLRAAFSEMPKDRVWSPVMQNAMRRSYLFEMRAFETARKLGDLDPHGLMPGLAAYLEADLRPKLDKVARGIRLKFQEARDSYDGIQRIGEIVAGQYLSKTWRRGFSETLAEFEGKMEAKTTDRPQPLSVEEKQRKVAAEFVALPYLFFIRVNLLQIHNLLFFVAGGFVLVVFSIGSYPFQSPRVLGWCMTGALVALGYGVARIFAQMARDAILSRITDSEPGKLDADFYLKLVSAGVLPVLSVVLSQFPSVGRFLFSWLQPTLEAIR